MCKCNNCTCGKDSTTVHDAMDMLSGITGIAGLIALAFSLVFASVYFISGIEFVYRLSVSSIRTAVPIAIISFSAAITSKSLTKSD